ncbi:hypothetical protein, partial [Microbacterium mangrovi]|uniref:hypothetical protein n=1 Tax=Microbacterium mangrovi TaxID=1348253 RepID=UPI001E3D7620
ELIQRNLTNRKTVGRGYLAFDKCTLLSSQGSDAPGVRDLTGRFPPGQLLYPKLARFRLSNSACRDFVASRFRLTEDERAPHLTRPAGLLFCEGIVFAT